MRTDYTPRPLKSAFIKVAVSRKGKNHFPHLAGFHNVSHSIYPIEQNAKTKRWFKKYGTKAARREQKRITEEAIALHHFDLEQDALCAYHEDDWYGDSYDNHASVHEYAYREDDWCDDWYDDPPYYKHHDLYEEDRRVSLLEEYDQEIQDRANVIKSHHVGMTLEQAINSMRYERHYY